MQFRFTLLCFAVALLGFMGCGGDNMAELKGNVSYDGQPVAKGSIGLVPVDGKGPTAGGEIKDGKYQVRAPIGNLKVEIRYPIVVGKKKDYDAPGGKFYDVYDERLPDKYNNATELTVEVKAGANTKDWDLKK